MLQYEKFSWSGFKKTSIQTTIVHKTLTPHLKSNRMWPFVYSDFSFTQQKRVVHVWIAIYIFSQLYTDRKMLIFISPLTINKLGVHWAELFDNFQNSVKKRDGTNVTWKCSNQPLKIMSKVQKVQVVILPTCFLTEQILARMLITVRTSIMHGIKFKLPIHNMRFTPVFLHMQLLSYF